MSLLTARAVAGLIGVDAVRAGAASSQLGSGSDFAEFRATITAAGHTVVPLTTFDAASLSGLDAVIVRQASQSSTAFSGAEILALHAFVGAGRGLVVIGEGGFAADSTTGNLSTLVSSFGVSYVSTAVEPDGLTISGFRSHPVTAGLHTIGVDFARPMGGIAPTAFDLTLASGSSDVLAAIDGTGGRGNVLLLGDSSMFSTAAVNDRPLAFGDNRRLLRNAIEFVAAPIPEPSSALFGVGLLLTLAGRSLRRRA